ncbi:MAG: LUD domain-containing protein [Bacteroidetes bacterium]|nr:LUD domain-containing protein [Bacteroidota bacterium]
MQDSTSKEKVLKNIRAALVNPMLPPFPPQDTTAPVLQPLEDEDSLDVSFAMAFNAVGGQFVYTLNSSELKEGILSLINQKDYKTVYCSIPDIKDFLIRKKVQIIEDESQVPHCDLVISDCECLIARFGSIVFSSKQSLSRKGIASPESHIVVANNNQVVKDIKDAMTYLKDKYENVIPSMLSVVTGPSRTADIEKTLVMGAHGQKELFVFMLG